MELRQIAFSPRNKVTVLTQSPNGLPSARSRRKLALRSQLTAAPTPLRPIGLRGERYRLKPHCLSPNGLSSARVAFAAYGSNAPKSGCQQHREMGTPKGNRFAKAFRSSHLPMPLPHYLSPTGLPSARSRRKLALRSQLTAAPTPLRPIGLRGERYRLKPPYLSPNGLTSARVAFAAYGSNAPKSGCQQHRGTRTPKGYRSAIAFR